MKIAVAVVSAFTGLALGVPLQVDLDYAIYKGVANSTTKLTTFKAYVNFDNRAALHVKKYEH